MRPLLAFAMAISLFGQETPKEPGKAKSPAPATENWLAGTMDLGYRWITGVGGSFDTYRSIVNLGEGPKLLNTDLTLLDPSKRFFDRVNIRGSNWGGDPYNTARIDATKEYVYDLTFDYRNIAYFNFLPSFANPLIDRGILMDQRSFDTHRRLADFQLDLRPGSRVIPYLAYTHNSGFGTGITDFVNGASNEYAVAEQLRDKTDNYRGGIRFELNRFHVTLEQGGTTFKDAQQVFSTGRNPGNRTTPLLGQQLFLSNLLQAYGIRGDSIYSKVLFTANPSLWLDLYGQFLYSRPETEVHYAQNATGLFADVNPILFFNSQQEMLSAEARQPHSSGSFGAELRPFRRLRIVEAWMTDRLHVASSLQDQSAAPLIYNYNQQQLDVILDLTSRLTVRGGHRYVWDDAGVRAAGPAALPGIAGLESGEVRRQVGLGGVHYRAGQKLTLNADFESASGDRTYFRTSLDDYKKFRARARYQASSSLSVVASFSLLDNHNPAPTVKYDFLNRQNSVSFFWTPGGGKRISLLGDYTRSSLRSDLTYLVPQTLERARSFYRDNTHSASAMLDFALRQIGGLRPAAGAGGSFFVSSGSRPTRYYQPLARLSFPIGKHAQWNTEWRWYGFTERFYRYEDFRTNQFVTGLRLTR